MARLARACYVLRRDESSRSCAMTSLLEKALQGAARLPEAEQDRIARLILDEIEDEARWQCSFATSQDRLAALADAAREEISRDQ
jgi:hypothetical protein